MRRSTLIPGLLTVATLVATAACGGSTEASLDTQVPGVTDETISLGVLGDLSGKDSALGLSVTKGAQLYVDSLNAGDGLCGRQVELVVRDHASDLSTAAGLYAEMEPQVLGFVEMQGTEVISSLLPGIEGDRALTAAVSGSSSLLKNAYVLQLGATTDVQAVVALSWMVAEGTLAAGDTVGHLHTSGLDGDDALLGSKYAGRATGLLVADATIATGDSSAAAEIAELEDARISALVLSTAPDQTLAALDAVVDTDLDVPLVLDSGSFTPSTLRQLPEELLDRITVVTPYEPVTTADPEVTTMLDAFRAGYPDAAPDGAVLYGWAVAAAYTTLVADTCAAGDLTRGSMSREFLAAGAVDLGDIVPDLDLSDGGAPGSRSVWLSRPDPEVEGGLTADPEEPVTTDAAAAYPAPAQE